MEKTILIVGKDMPEASVLADGFSMAGRNVSVAGPESAQDEVKKTIAQRKAAVAEIEENLEKQAQTGVCTIEWNRSSSLSARNLVLQTENLYGNFSESLVYFDQDLFAQNANNIDVSEISSTCDDMILGFQYITLEIISRFEKNFMETGKPGTLIFLIKEGPNSLDAFRLPSVRNGVNVISSPLIAAAASAFTSFAENIAALYGGKEFINIILVRGDKGNDTLSTDKALAGWLVQYLDQVESAKSKVGPKTAVQWKKPGSKVNSIFNLFGLIKW